jgi:hypothetical protein
MIGSEPIHGVRQEAHQLWTLVAWLVEPTQSIKVLEKLFSPRQSSPSRATWGVMF